MRGFQPDCAYYRSYNVLTLFHAPPDPRPLYQQTLLAWGFSTCLASCLAFGIGDMDHTNGHEDNEFVVSKNAELVLWLFELSTYFRRMVSESLSCISSSVGVFLNNFVNCPILKDFVLLSEIEVLIKVCACRLGIPRDEGTGSTRPRSFFLSSPPSAVIVLVQFLSFVSFNQCLLSSTFVSCAYLAICNWKLDLTKAALGLQTTQLPVGLVQSKSLKGHLQIQNRIAGYQKVWNNVGCNFSCSAWRTLLIHGTWRSHGGREKEIMASANLSFSTDKNPGQDFERICSPAVELPT